MNPGIPVCLKILNHFLGKNYPGKYSYRTIIDLRYRNLIQRNSALMSYAADSEVPDQTAHPRSLIRVFAIRLL